MTDPERFANVEEARCKTYRDLDAKWGTPVDSPLHHDNNCPIHGKW